MDMAFMLYEYEGSLDEFLEDMFFGCFTCCRLNTLEWFSAGTYDSDYYI